MLTVVVLVISQARNNCKAHRELIRTPCSVAALIRCFLAGFAWSFWLVRAAFRFFPFCVVLPTVAEMDGGISGILVGAVGGTEKMVLVKSVAKPSGEKSGTVSSSRIDLVASDRLTSGGTDDWSGYPP